MHYLSKYFHWNYALIVRCFSSRSLQTYNKVSILDRSLLNSLNLKTYGSLGWMRICLKHNTSCCCLNILHTLQTHSWKSFTNMLIKHFLYRYICIQNQIFNKYCLFCLSLTTRNMLNYRGFLSSFWWMSKEVCLQCC